MEEWIVSVHKRDLVEELKAPHKCGFCSVCIVSSNTGMPVTGSNFMHINITFNKF